MLKITISNPCCLEEADVAFFFTKPREKLDVDLTHTKNKTETALFSYFLVI